VSAAHERLALGRVLHARERAHLLRGLERVNLVL
jgi:hypothetical protein